MGRVIVTLFVMLTSIGCAGGHLAGDRSKPWSPDKMPVPELELARTWDGETFHVPPPALMPAAFYQTPQWTRWWHIGNVTTLVFVKSDGTRYEAEMVLRGRNEQGELHPLMQTVSRFRPDGTLAVQSTIVGGDTGPHSWKTFAPDGKTVTMEISTHRERGSQVTTYVDHVWFCDESGKQDRLYHANAQGDIEYEWDMNGREFVRPLNGGRKAKKRSPSP